MSERNEYGPIDYDNWHGSGAERHHCMSLQREVDDLRKCLTTAAAEGEAHSLRTNLSAAAEESEAAREVERISNIHPFSGGSLNEPMQRLRAARRVVDQLTDGKGPGVWVKM